MRRYDDIVLADYKFALYVTADYMMEFKLFVGFSTWRFSLLVNVTKRRLEFVREQAHHFTGFQNFMTEIFAWTFVVFENKRIIFLPIWRQEFLVFYYFF